MARQDIEPIQYSIPLNNEFNYYYAVDKTNLNKLMGVLSSNDISSFFKNLFNKSADCINSIKLYPFSHQNLFSIFRETNSFFQPDTYYPATGEKIKIGDKQYNVYGFPISNSKVYKSYFFKKFSSLGLKNSDFTSFIDLSPYAEYQLYIPYIGIIDLSSTELFHKDDLHKPYLNSFDVKVSLDLSSGYMTAYIVNMDGGIVATKTSKVAIDIPFGGDNATDMAKNVVSSVLSTAIGIKAGTIALSKRNKLASVAIGKTISSGAESIINSLEHKFERGGNAGNESLLFDYNKMYMIVTKPVLTPINEEEYAHTYGKPLFEERTLSTLKGFTIIDDVHLTGFESALDGELEEIETLLKTGVHF